MAALCSGFSSSDSEEDLARLKEAVDDSLFTQQNRSIDNDSRDIPTKTDSTLPSKRPDRAAIDVENGNHVMHTTPGFRRHVGRKLSQSLDSEIDSTGACFHAKLISAAKDNRDECGIKLFGSSKAYLTSTCDVVQPKVISTAKRKPSSSSDSSSEDERLAEASVSHEFVVEQSSLPFYTHQRPADVIINRQGVKDMHVAMETDGERKDGENKMKTAGSNLNEQTLVNVDNKKKENVDIESEKSSSNCRKKKKKKKKSS